MHLLIVLPVPTIWTKQGDYNGNIRRFANKIAPRAFATAIVLFSFVYLVAMVWSQITAMPNRGISSGAFAL